MSPLEEEIHHLLHHGCPGTRLSRLFPMPTLGLVPSARHPFLAPPLPSSCPTHATSTSGDCSILIILHSLRSSAPTSHYPRPSVSYRKCLVTFSATTVLARCSFLSSPHPCYTLTTLPCCDFPGDNMVRVLVHQLPASAHCHLAFFVISFPFP